MINVRVGLARNSSIATADFNTAVINFNSPWSQVLSDSSQGGNNISRVTTYIFPEFRLQPRGG
tara:strand:- start:297 stop:485 length:189 start_codon:yes stop_codon:yes gene_type:complete